MARESPPTRRVTTLLDTVVAAPGHDFSLAELAKQTGISKATCLGILNELCTAGYLTRATTERTYRPGPALLTAGAAAQASYATVDAALPALRALAAELDAPVTVSVRSGNQALIVARLGPHPDRTPALRAGLRTPLVAPGALLFFAWSDDVTLDRWLRHNGPPAGAVDQAHVDRVVAAARRDAYLIERLNELDPALFALLAELGRGPMPAQLSDVIRRTLEAGGMEQYVLDDIQRRHRYDVGYVVAPVYDPSGEPAFLVSMLLMQPGVDGGDLQRCAGALRDATARITASLGGRDPWASPTARSGRRSAAR